MPGIAEVFHAHFVDHVYPAHTHDSWTLLVVDNGAIRFDLDRHRHGTVGAMVTLLPPHVPHDGRAATQYGFRKRVLYLDTSVLDERLTGAAVAEPSLSDRLLRERIHQLHLALAQPDEALEAESRLALIRERLYRHFGRTADEPGQLSGRRLAGELAAEILHAHPVHLVRSFTDAFGLPPHRYLTGRRVDLARRRLLAGEPAASVAVEVGFHDQSHLTRHFVRHLGVGPAEYARTHRRLTPSARRAAGPG